MEGKCQDIAGKQISNEVPQYLTLATYCTSLAKYLDGFSSTIILLALMDLKRSLNGILLHLRTPTIVKS